VNTDLGVAMKRDVLTEAEADRVAEVFQEHRTFVESVARQHSPHPQDVPDIVQAVGLRVCRGLTGFREESALTTWLYRMTVNTARSHYRQERRAARAVAVLAAHPGPEPVVDPDEQAIQGERSQALHEALNRMRPAAANLIRDELTSQCVISYRSRSTRYRARQALRCQLEDDPRVDQ
jgi:RNA polymerase sigma-70 factor (ECF subfamily)